jgi:hypothetical protein
MPKASGISRNKPTISIKSVIPANTAPIMIKTFEKIFQDLSSHFSLR